MRKNMKESLFVRISVQRRLDALFERTGEKKPEKLEKATRMAI